MSADEIKARFALLRFRTSREAEIEKLNAAGKVSKALALKREGDTIAFMGQVIPIERGRLRT